MRRKGIEHMMETSYVETHALARGNLVGEKWRYALLDRGIMKGRCSGRAAVPLARSSLFHPHYDRREGAARAPPSVQDRYWALTNTAVIIAQEPRLYRAATRTHPPKTMNEPEIEIEN